MHMGDGSHVCFSVYCRFPAGGLTCPMEPICPSIIFSLLLPSNKPAPRWAKAPHHVHSFPFHSASRNLHAWLCLARKFWSHTDIFGLVWFLIPFFGPKPLIGRLFDAMLEIDRTGSQHDQTECGYISRFRERIRNCRPTVEKKRKQRGH